MAKTDELTNAKSAKADEFYTQFTDIQKEVNTYIEYNPDVFKNKTILLPCDDPEWSNFTLFFAQNFSRFGIKKLISTSYAAESKILTDGYKLTPFEKESPLFDIDKTRVKGKIFTLTEDTNKDGKINKDDIQWKYLDGDGDFRSEEVKKLRDEADIIITNPPFSLFREFLSWIMEANKQFLIIGNINAISYKEVFPLIQNNKLWLGPSISSGDREFGVPDSYPLNAASSRIDENGKKYIRVKGVRWYTNLEHGRRHQPIELMTISDNLKFNKSLIKKLLDFNTSTYPNYDNYEGIEVPFSDAIPSDYDGIMGVPITFLDKYCPEQFQIIGTISAPSDPNTLNSGKSYSEYIGYTQDRKLTGRTGSTFGKCPVIVMDDHKHPYYEKNGIRVQTTYHRIFIKKIK